MVRVLLSSSNKTDVSILFDSLNGILKKTNLSKKKWRLSQRITVLRTEQNVNLKKQGEKGEVYFKNFMPVIGNITLSDKLN